MSVDLSVPYLGMTLRNPLVVSACPLTGELDVLQRLEDLGAGAAVLPSLFIEQIHTASQKHNDGIAFESDNDLQQLSCFHQLKYYNRGPEEYLRHLEEAKKTVSIPLIASLNGAKRDGWVSFVRRLEAAGANALELNLYQVIADPRVTAERLENQYLDVVAAVRAETKLPLAVKVGPYFTAFANMAQRLEKAGANGLVLFNRFIQPDIDIDHLRVVPRLSLSTPDEERLPLRWIGILRKHTNMSLAATGGIHFVDGAVKALLAGANVTMVASVLYRHGVGYLATLLSELQYWMDQSEFRSVREMIGSLSHDRSPNPTVYERANYMHTLTSFVDGID